jgi:hypothetical protein
VAVSFALTAADEALYVAEREGRDRIVARSDAVPALPSKPVDAAEG